MRKSLLTLSLLAATAAPAMAADYSDGDIHKNDYKFLQFNLMGAFKEKGVTESSHDYLEMEFGGRSGIFDLYGYVDIFNLTSDSSSDKADADAKIFMKFAPRVSLDALTGKDLSFGPVQELYLASLVQWDGNNGGLNTQNIGLGSDVMVPWFGKMGMNLYKTYDSGKKDWNGYHFAVNWFKPFYFFENGSFISYQGYIDYQFGMKDEYNSANEGADMFNGIYWHSDRFAVGYGLKLFKDVYGFKDDAGLPWDSSSKAESTGVGHYVSVTYKF